MDDRLLENGNPEKEGKRREWKERALRRVSQSQSKRLKDKIEKR